MATVIEHPRGQPRNFTWTVGRVRYIVKDIILEPYTEIQNKIIAEEDRVGPDEGCSAWRGRMLESKAQFQAPFSCSGPEVCISAHPIVRTGNAGIVFRKAERETTVRPVFKEFLRLGSPSPTEACSPTEIEASSPTSEHQPESSVALADISVFALFGS